MTKRFLMLVLGLWTVMAFAQGNTYVMRVDGLACPYCAYGIEKKFMKIPGVRRVDVDLDKGRVTVEVDEGVELTESQMHELFQEAGFTYRATLVHPGR